MARQAAVWATLLCLILTFPSSSMAQGCPFAGMGSIGPLTLPVSEIDIPVPGTWVPPEYSAPSNCSAAIYKQIGQELAGLAMSGLAPAMLRAAFHSCGTYSASGCDAGCNGGWLQFPNDLTNAINGGINDTVVALKGLKQRFPCITVADLLAFAGAVAPEAVGGPAVAWYPGRRDALSPGPSRPTYSSRLPFPTFEASAALVYFTNLGLTIREAVTLTGAGHSLGGAHPNVSGWNGSFTPSEKRWPAKLNQYFTDLVDHSWDEEVLDCQFPGFPPGKCVQYVLAPGQPNATATAPSGAKVIRFPVDMAMRTTGAFAFWVVAYAKNESAFVHDFQRVMQRLLQLGAGQSWEADTSYLWRGLKGNWGGFGPNIQPQLDTEGVPAAAGDPISFLQQALPQLVQPSSRLGSQKVGNASQDPMAALLSAANIAPAPAAPVLPAGGLVLQLLGAVAGLFNPVVTAAEGP